MSLQDRVLGLQRYNGIEADDEGIYILLDDVLTLLAQSEEPGAVRAVLESVYRIVVNGHCSQDVVTVIGKMRDASALAARPAEEGRWIPVSERLPEERVEVAAYFRTGDITEVHIGEVKGGTWGDRHGGEWLAQPTHWMPLPAPSQSGGKP